MGEATLPPQLFIPSQCLMTKARTNTFPHTRIDCYYSLDSKSYVDFTEEITKKRKKATDDDVNDAGHTTRRKIMKRKHNINDANVETDGLRKMKKDTESKFKLLLVATMMKNRTNVHDDAESNACCSQEEEEDLVFFVVVAVVVPFDAAFDYIVHYRSGISPRLIYYVEETQTNRRQRYYRC